MITHYGFRSNSYDATFWVGLGISLVTNMIQGFALAFQRKSHILNDQIYPRELQRHAFLRPLWVASFTAFLVANITGSIFSVGYLPVVILAPIGAMNLVFNAIAARIVLGNPFSAQRLVGTMLVIIGALLVGMFGVIQEPNHSLEDLMHLYQRPAFIIYFGILETLILTAMIYTHYWAYQFRKAERMIPKPNELSVWRWRVPLSDLKTYLGISFGLLSGNISSQSLLFAKSGVELFILTLFYGENQLGHVLTWILVVMMILTAILQLYYLNKGLQLCDTVVLVPLSFCAFNISCLFNSLLYYDQWDRLRWWQLLSVLVGVAITVTGVVLLSWRKSYAAVHTQEETVAVTPTQRLNYGTVSQVGEHPGIYPFPNSNVYPKRNIHSV